MRWIQQAINSVSWARAMTRIGRDEPKRAIPLLLKIARSDPTSIHLAAVAKCYLLENKSDLAGPFLEQARLAAEEHSSPISEYVKVYCEVYLTIMQDQNACVAALLRTAQQIDCHPAVKRWLPLPDPGADETFARSPTNVRSAAKVRVSWEGPRA